MHGLGNDFIIIDAMSAPRSLDARHIRALADRHRGIGFDQLLILEPGARPTELGYRIYNADGSRAGQCGNGMRCLARYACEQGYMGGETLIFNDGHRRIEARIAADGLVTVNMDFPLLTPAAIPLLVSKQAPGYTLEVNGLAVEIGAVSVGNPHAVLKVEDLAAAPVAELGAAIETHPLFPERTNVGFLELRAPNRIGLRVWERGTGETLACGSGACAAVVWGRIMGWLESEVLVELPGGLLKVFWGGPGESVWMTGPAVRVFQGELCDQR